MVYMIYTYHEKLGDASIFVEKLRVKSKKKILKIAQNNKGALRFSLTIQDLLYIISLSIVLTYFFIVLIPIFTRGIWVYMRFFSIFLLINKFIKAQADTYRVTILVNLPLTDVEIPIF